MTLIDVLQNIAAPAGIAAVAAVIASVVLEHVPAFKALSGNGKFAVATAFAVLAAVLANAGAQALVARPDIAAQVEPYAQIVIAGVALIIQQLTHGATKKPEDGAKG
jgi:hypothetical protein